MSRAPRHGAGARGRSRTRARLTDSELDVCDCGDYRRDHPQNGPCVFGRLHGIPPADPLAYCGRFRLMKRSAAERNTASLKHKAKAPDPE